MIVVKSNLTARDILTLLQKQWLDTQDVMKIGSVSRVQAIKIKSDICEQLDKDKIYYPKGLVPSSKVADYCNIDISYLKKISS